ncbi:MAG: hypothetical protein IPQ07_38830 [Myxococcales bacterium]|nr:hypothetical protein [Myxococcales bacterium]
MTLVPSSPVRTIEHGQSARFTERVVARFAAALSNDGAAGGPAGAGLAGAGSVAGGGESLLHAARRIVTERIASRFRSKTITAPD